MNVEKIIPETTLQQFINDQRDNRPLNFGININVHETYGDCGCVLIHYARDVGNLSGTITAGLEKVWEGSPFDSSKVIEPPDKDFTVDLVSLGVRYKPTTYKALKDLITGYGLDK